MALLAVMMVYRSWLTPEFLHVLTAVEDDEAHCITVMLLWLWFRCFLEPNTQSSKSFTTEKLWDDRLKVFARCSLEFNLTMLTMLFHYEQSHWPWVYSTVVLLLAAIRSVLKEWLDFPFFVAIVAYLAQNLIVNIIDLALFK